MPEDYLRPKGVATGNLQKRSMEDGQFRNPPTYAQLGGFTDAAKGTVESVAMRDLYRGQQAGAGKKSFAVRVVLRSASGTLSEEDVDKAMRRIQGRLERQLGAVLRS